MKYLLPLIIAVLFCSCGTNRRTTELIHELQKAEVRFDQMLDSLELRVHYCAPPNYNGVDERWQEIIELDRQLQQAEEFSFWQETPLPPSRLTTPNEEPITVGGPFGWRPFPWSRESRNLQAELRQLISLYE